MWTLLGLNIARRTGTLVRGSPANALLIEPPFREYHFIDLDSRKVESLGRIAADRSNVHVHEGDCNLILLHDVFPRVRYEDYRRALCLLDPYRLQPNWEVIEAAGRMGTIDLFLNFPTMTINRNVLRPHPSPVQVEVMNTYWGDSSWREVAYVPQGSLFTEAVDQKTPTSQVVRAFQERLKNAAGFSHVPAPLPMRNRQGGIVYHLFFASQKPVAADIVEQVFSKHRQRGMS